MARARGGAAAHPPGPTGPGMSACRVADPLGRDALEGKGRQRRPQERVGRRLEEVAKAVGGGCCRLQMPLALAVAVRETVAGRRLGALEGGGVPPLLPMYPCPWRTGAVPSGVVDGTKGCGVHATRPVSMPLGPVGPFL